MKKVLLIATAILITACQGKMGGTGASGATGPQGPAAPAPTPAPAPTALEEQVQIYDELLVAEGRDPVTQGLDCTIYNAPTTTTAIIGATGLTTVGSFTYTGEFNQPNAAVTTGFNVLPAPLQPVIQTWFIMKCTGVLIMDAPNWHSFDVASDDGSNLYVDGLLINNDGLHSIQDKAATKFLSAGVHSFEVDYLQGAGMQALIVNMDGSLLPSANLFH
jgi:PA14 domain